MNRYWLLLLVPLALLLVADAPQAQEPAVYTVFMPVIFQPPWVDDPAKSIAGYAPMDASETMRHHAQMQWNLTCKAGLGVDCINHLKYKGMLEYYDDRPGLLVDTLTACSGGEWWYGDEFNLYGESYYSLSQWVEEAHWIRGLFDQYAPDGCLFGFGVPFIQPMPPRLDGLEWIQRFHDLYLETYGEPLAVDVYVVDDYYMGSGTYERAVKAHKLIRSLYGDIRIEAREWGCLADWPDFGCQREALDYACATGWHKLYDRYFFFIGMGGEHWGHTELYNDGKLTELGRWYAAFPSWYCIEPWAWQ